MRQLRATLKRAGIDLADLKNANERAGQTVAQWAGVRAPRRSGALGATVRAARQVGRARVMAGGGAVPYAGPIHWGWPARNITAQPWISESAQQTEPAWVRDYLDEINKVIGKVRGA